MNEELFNLFYAIGIGLTFMASVGTIIVSIISLQQTSKSTKHIGYLNTISTTRYKWSTSIREQASMYFTQIARLCAEQESNVVEIYNELVHYHFAISLLLFENDKNLQDKLDRVKELAWDIVYNNQIIDSYYEKYDDRPEITKEYIESQQIVIEARQKIYKTKCSIVNNYQNEIFEDIRALVELEWRKQQDEANKIK
ncbi:MAG: hypothetical protein J6K12_06995 [Clostridia bacterium]|nr:hypothetical protein [Clostridia bacterium]